jgi:hypothetical protein
LIEIPVGAVGGTFTFLGFGQAVSPAAIVSNPVYNAILSSVFIVNSPQV